MSHFKRSFPSRFVQVAEVEDGPIDRTIKSVKTENVGTDDAPEEKLVAHFTEVGAKPLVLNLTRAEAIADTVGNPDTDSWVGARIRVIKGRTQFKGKRVDCLDVVPSPIHPGESVDEAVGF